MATITSQKPNSERHLTVVPELKRPNYRRRRAKAAALAIATTVGAGMLVQDGIEAVKKWGDNTDDARANAAPKAGEICVVEVQGAKPGDISTIQLADRYGDGTTKIQSLSENAGLVMNAHPKEGVGICRPADSTELNDNHIVNPETIPEAQLVDDEVFKAAGGVSDDIG